MWVTQELTTSQPTPRGWQLRRQNLFTFKESWLGFYNSFVNLDSYEKKDCRMSSTKIEYSGLCGDGGGVIL